MNALWVEFVSYGSADTKDGILAGKKIERINRFKFNIVKLQAKYLD